VRYFFFLILFVPPIIFVESLNIPCCFSQRGVAISLLAPKSTQLFKHNCWSFQSRLLSPIKHRTRPVNMVGPTRQPQLGWSRWRAEREREREGQREREREANANHCTALHRPALSSLTPSSWLGLPRLLAFVALLRLSKLWRI
jgi:hypothetical protein